MNAGKIKIFEDEQELADILKLYLVKEGFDVQIRTHGMNAVEDILQDKPDLVVLDINLPGKDGITICEELRQRSKVPIIMETAKIEEVDRLLGLESGADDYMCKPFSPKELVARVKAVLRRAGGDYDEISDKKNAIQIDRRGWIAKIDGQGLDLTRREFQVLALLVEHPGRIFSRQQILELAFENDDEVFDRTIDVHIRNIRSKVKKLRADFDPIRSVYGVGYSVD